MKTLITIVLGFLFGSVLIATRAFHWYQIQEMFHFDSIYMFGLLFSAIVTGIVSLVLLRRLKIKSIYGNEIKPVKKETRLKPNLIGGVFFGFGWAITGACAAPALILLGANWIVGVFILLGVIIGVLLFAVVKSRLPN